MVYETTMRHIREIEGENDFVLLNEIHSSSDPMVVADLQFTKDSTQYRYAYVTTIDQKSGSIANRKSKHYQH